MVCDVQLTVFTALSLDIGNSRSDDYSYTNEVSFLMHLNKSRVSNSFR